MPDWFIPEFVSIHPEAGPFKSGSLPIYKGSNQHILSSTNRGSLQESDQTLK